MPAPSLGADGSNRDLRAVFQRLAGEIIAWIDHRPGSVDDVIAAVDIERLAGDQFGPVHRQEGHGDADILDRDEAAGRRLGLGLGDQFVEVGDARGCTGLERPGRDGMYPDAFRPELGSEIAQSRIPGRP